VVQRPRTFRRRNNEAEYPVSFHMGTTSPLKSRGESNEGAIEDAVEVAHEGDLVLAFGPAGWHCSLGFSAALRLSHEWPDRHDIGDRHRNR